MRAELAAEKAEAAHNARRQPSGGVTVHVAVGRAGGGDGSGESRTASFGFKKAEAEDEQTSGAAACQASEAASASGGADHKAMTLTELTAPEGTVYVSDDISAPLSCVGPRVTSPEDAVSFTVEEGEKEAVAEEERAANSAAGTMLAADHGNFGGGGASPSRRLSRLSEFVSVHSPAAAAELPPARCESRLSEFTAELPAERAFSGAAAMFAELRARRLGRGGGMARPASAGGSARAFFANRDARSRWLAATAALTKDATERTGALRARLVCAQAARSALAHFACEPDGARTSTRVLGQARARVPPPQPLPPDPPHMSPCCDGCGQ